MLKIDFWKDIKKVLIGFFALFGIWNIYFAISGNLPQHTKGGGFTVQIASIAGVLGIFVSLFIYYWVFLKKGSEKITGRHFAKIMVGALILAIGSCLINSLFAGAGILAVIIGFASQQAFANIVNGVLIIIFKPFRVGDWVRIKEIAGNVEDITLRHTIIRSPENKHIIIPNSVISAEIIENSNIKDERVCKILDFSISYDSNIDKAIRIIQSEAKKHPFFLDHRKDVLDKEPAVPVRVVSWGESGINLKAWIWARTPGEGFQLKCDLLKSIKERFDREKIEIPYPTRMIINKKK